MGHQGMDIVSHAAGPVMLTAGAALTATGAGAPIGIPLMLAGAGGTMGRELGGTKGMGIGMGAGGLAGGGLGAAGGLSGLGGMMSGMSGSNLLQGLMGGGAGTSSIGNIAGMSPMAARGALQTATAPSGNPLGGNAANLPGMIAKANGGIMDQLLTSPMLAQLMGKSGGQSQGGPQGPAPQPSPMMMAGSTPQGPASMPQPQAPITPAGAQGGGQMSPQMLMLLMKMMGRG